jgi:hypothetical protein
MTPDQGAELDVDVADTVMRLNAQWDGTDAIDEAVSSITDLVLRHIGRLWKPVDQAPEGEPLLAMQYDTIFLGVKFADGSWYCQEYAQSMAMTPEMNWVEMTPHFWTYPPKLGPQQQEEISRITMRTAANDR